MPRAALSLIPVLLTSIALAGCGGSGGSDRASAPGGADAPSRVSLVPVTDGRTGDAVTGTDAGPIRQLSRGGRPDASEPRPGKGRRDGVAAGDACSDAELVPSPDTLGRLESITLCLLNGQRADRGLPALGLNAKLARAAVGHAADMAAKSYFAHEGSDGSTVKDRIEATGYIPSSGRWVIGENLAWGTGALATPKAIVNAWMNSAGHRSNILHADYREIGFGIVAGNPRVANGLGAIYVTEFGVVGEPDAASPDAPETGDAPPAARPPTVSRAATKKPARARCGKSRRARRSRARNSRAAKVCAKRARARRASARS